MVASNLMLAVLTTLPQVHYMGLPSCFDFADADVFLLLIAAAWVHRGFSDDVTELRTVQPGGDLLTDFQKDKFRYFFFHVLDLNSDNVISSEDFDRLNEVGMG